MKRKIKNKIGVMCLVLVMVCAAILQYSDWLHAQSTTPFKYIFEEKLDELLMISKLELKIEKSDKITITDVKYEEEVLSFNEVNNEFVFVKEFKENGTYEFVISYQEKIEKEVTEAESSKESKILKQAGIDKEPSVEDIPVDKVEEASKNILEKKIVEDWSETKTMNVEYKVKDIGALVNVPVDKIEPIAPDKIETVDKEPVKPKEEPVVPKEEIPIEDPVVPKEEVPVEKEEPVTPKEEPIEEVSKSCYEVNNGVIIGLKPVDHVGCENKDHLILDIPSIIDEQRITEIGKDAFINHSEITEVILPDSIMKIDEMAFAGTSSLLHMSIMGEIQEIHMTAFEGSSVKEIDVSHQYESELKDFPWGASKEVKVTFKPVPQLAPAPVMNMPKAVNDQSACFEVNGGEITEFKEMGHTGCTNPEHKNVVIPASINNTSVTSIGVEAFYNCTSLTNITLPNTLTSIGNSAFYKCSRLMSITVPGVTHIGSSAFHSCEALTSVTQTNSLIEIGPYAFILCGALPEITLPEGLKKIGPSAFRSCSSLTSIIIPDSVVEIGESTFVYCIRLGKVDVSTKNYGDIANSPWGVNKQNIYWKSNGSCFDISDEGVLAGFKPFDHENCARSGDHSVADISSEIRGIEVKVIGGLAFYNCSYLKEVILPDTITTIDAQAFYNNYSIASGINRSTITFGPKVDNVASNAFSSNFIGTIKIPHKEKGGIAKAPWGANALVSIEWKVPVLPEASTDFFIFGAENTITDYQGNGYPTDLVIPEFYTVNGVEKQVLHIGARAFAGKGLTSVQFNSQIQTIGDSAFFNCGVEVTSITLPDTVSDIGESAFANIIKLEVLNLGSGVKNVGNLAFSELPMLKSIKLNNGIETMGENVFKGCSALTLLDIPDSVTSLGQGAFNLCTGLQKLIIGSGVTNVDNLGISACTKLVEVAIGGHIDTLPSDLFKGMALVKLHLLGNLGNSVTGYPWGSTKGQKMKVYWRENNTCFDISTSGELLGFKPNDHRECTQQNNHKLAIIPSKIDGQTVTSIASYAFYGTEKTSINPWQYEEANISSLQKVVVPDTVYTIGKNAFYHYYKITSNLKEVHLGKGITTLNSTLFSSSQDVSIYLLDKEYDEVKNQPWGATVYNKVYWKNNETCFYWDDAGTLLRLAPNGHVGCTNPGHKVVTVPPQLGGKDTISIGEKAFASSHTTEQIILPSTLTNIGIGAFNRCSSLIDINLPVNLQKIEDNVFGLCTSLVTITIPSTVTSIGENAFTQCNALSQFTLPENLKSIGKQAFIYCSSVTSITIPNTVSSIGEGAFRYCVKLSEVTLGTKVTILRDYVFGSCDALKEMRIPENITIMYVKAFDRTPLEKVYITEKDPGSIANAPWGSSNGGLTEIYWKDIDPTSCFWIDARGVVLGFKPTGHSDNCLQPGHKKAIIPNKIGEYDVKSIGNKAFARLLITEVRLPNTIITIGEDAFSRCTDLTNITLPTSLISIGGSAFIGCEKLLEIIIPNTVTSIGTHAFRECKALIRAKLPDGLKTIGEYLFYFCTSLKEIEIPNTVNYIRSTAFRDCDSLEKVVIPDSVTTINYYAFLSCDSLKEVVIGSGMRTLENMAFNSPIEKLTIRGNITTVENGGGFRSSTLKEVIFESTTAPDPTVPIFISLSPVEIIRFPNLKRQDIPNLKEYPFASTIEYPTYYFESNNSYFDIDATGIIYPKPSDHIDVVTLGKMEQVTNLTIPATLDTIQVIGLGGSLENFSNLYEINYSGAKLNATGNDYFNAPKLRIITFNQNMTSFTSPEETGGPLLLSQVKDIYFKENTLGSIGDANTKKGTPYTNWGRNGEMRTHFKEDNNDNACFYVDSIGTIIGIKPSNHDGCTQQNDHSYLEVPDTINTLSITKIKDYAFSSYGMNGVFEAIGLPNTLMEIGAHAFEGCSKLTGIDIPNSVTTIGDYAFAYSSIQSITFGTDLTTIGSHILDHVTLTEPLTLGENVTTVPDDAFTGLSMDLVDWENKPTKGLIQIKQISGSKDFHMLNPWGMDIAPDVKYKGDVVFLTTHVTYDNNKATIHYTVTPENGGTVSTIKTPDGKISSAGTTVNVELKGTFEASLNSREYNNGKGYVLTATSAANLPKTARVNVNGLVYMNLSANSFVYDDFNVDELDANKIINLSSASATKLSDNSKPPVTLKTPIDEIKASLMSQGGEAFVELQATCKLTDPDYNNEIDYTKTVSIQITSRSGNVTAKDHVMDQTNAKSITDTKDLKDIVSSSTTTVGASGKLYTTMKEEDFINFKSGIVGEYTVTSHLGRVTYDSKVKVVKDGSSISSDGLSSVYGHDIDLGKSGASKYTATQLLEKIRPEYEQPGVETVTGINAFTISDIEMDKLKASGLAINDEITIKITHIASTLTDEVTVTIVDDSPDLLVEIPQEVALNKSSDENIAATGEGTIKLVASNEHLSDLDIDIKTEENVEIKYLKDLSKFTTVDVYTSSDIKYNVNDVLMTLNSGVVDKKQGTFKLKLPKVKEENIPRGMYEGKMYFNIAFK